MKKIGIATQYTNSCNYGGVLQSYALCKKLTNMGYISNQICFIDKQESFMSKMKRLMKNGHIVPVIKNNAYDQWNKIWGKIFNSHYEINKRYKAFSDFRNEIPHTEIIYSYKSIKDCTEFDIYITGSDQVWRIGESRYISDFYWLNFVPKDKLKISYAASLSTKDVPKELHSKIRELLSDYKAISVREFQDKQILDKIIGNNKAQWVLDPTLLLSKDEWIDLCEKNPYKKQPYVFVYLLGNNKKQRSFIRKWAKRNNKIIIFIPYLLGQYRGCDRKFGDIRRSDVTPNLWLSLIRDADCVFTDSFHACVFSSIFHTPFYVFKRSSDKQKDSMNSRIYSLAELLECNDRIIEDNANMSDLPPLSDIDFILSDRKVAEQKKYSLEFLINALEG